MDKFIEYKDFTGEVKDVDVSKRIVTGYLSDFDSLDSDDDRIIKGSFTKSITERKNKIFFLNQHNWQQPLSKFSVLQEDSKGLYFESEPLPDTSFAKDVITLYEAGVLKEHSIGFRTVKADYDSDTNVRNIKEVKLYEGSVVTLGANSNTPFTGMKGLSFEDVKDRAQLIIKMLKNGTLTDETFAQLELGLNSLLQEAYNLKNHSEPLIDTREPMQDEIKAINEFLKAK